MLQPGISTSIFPSSWRIQFIFSTALDGKIKAWLYDNVGSRVDYDAPGQWCTTMLYSADGSKLISRGANKEGDSFLICEDVRSPLKTISRRTRMPSQQSATSSCFV